MNTKKLPVAKILQSLRRIEDITLRELQTKSGISESTLKMYEFNNVVPSLNKIVKLTQYFGISVDYLLRQEQNPYLNYLKLIKLAEKIDKTDQIKRFQIEGTISSLLNNKYYENSTFVDDIEISLSSNIKDNLKNIRKFRGIKQREVTDACGISRQLISAFETRRNPTAEQLIILSDVYKVSCHAMLTGEKLISSNIKNKALEEAIIKADKLLSPSDILLLTRLMERTVDIK